MRISLNYLVLLRWINFVLKLLLAPLAGVARERRARGQEELARMPSHRGGQPIKVITRVPVVGQPVRVRGGAARRVQQRVRPLLDHVLLVVEAEQAHGRMAASGGAGGERRAEVARDKGGLLRRVVVARLPRTRRERLVLVCVEAFFCRYNLILQRSFRSDYTRDSHLCTAAVFK